MADLRPGQTLQPTALVHEAYLELVGGEDPGWNSRAHFFGAAAQAMREILVDQARKKGALETLQPLPGDLRLELFGDGRLARVASLKSSRGQTRSFEQGLRAVKGLRAATTKTRRSSRAARLVLDTRHRRSSMIGAVRSALRVTVAGWMLGTSTGHAQELPDCPAPPGASDRGELLRRQGYAVWESPSFAPCGDLGWFMIEAAKHERGNRSITCHAYEVPQSEEEALSPLTDPEAWEITVEGDTHWSASLTEYWRLVEGRWQPVATTGEHNEVFETDDFEQTLTYTLEADGPELSAGRRSGTVRDGDAHVGLWDRVHGSATECTLDLVWSREDEGWWGLETVTELRGDVDDAWNFDAWRRSTSSVIDDGRITSATTSTEVVDVSHVALTNTTREEVSSARRTMDWGHSQQWRRTTVAVEYHPGPPVAVVQEASSFEYEHRSSDGLYELERNTEMEGHEGHLTVREEARRPAFELEPDPRPAPPTFEVRFGPGTLLAPAMCALVVEFHRKESAIHAEIPERAYPLDLCPGSGGAGLVDGIPSGPEL